MTQVEDDQRDIICKLLSKLKEWLELKLKANNEADNATDNEANNKADKSSKFEQLLMTVTGVAGTGKTVLIKTLVTAIHRIFGLNESVMVFSPTGLSAHNAGGTTFLTGGAVRRKNLDWEMSEAASMLSDTGRLIMKK